MMMEGRLFDSVADELMAHRDAVLFGQWVPFAPRKPGQACMVLRYQGDVKETCLSIEATGLLSEVFKRLHPGAFYSSIGCPDVVWLGMWNDEQKDRVPVLELLDEAIRLAKERNL